MLEGTTHSEEHWADNSVSEHHEQSRSPAHWLHCCDTDENDTHVRYRGIGDHLLEVGLTQTNDGAPNQGDHTEDQQVPVGSTAEREGIRLNGSLNIP